MAGRYFGEASRCPREDNAVRNVSAISDTKDQMIKADCYSRGRFRVIDRCYVSH
jgi:hypothetical protein